MSRDKRVKDKRIMLKGQDLYLAVVEYFQDTPARDADKTIEEPCETMVIAQKFLAKFPRDIWDGHAPSEFNYRETDERRGYRGQSKLEAAGDLQDIRPQHREVQFAGRTFARLRGGGN
jgi:hypothetical protein